MRELLSVEEGAEELGVSVHTVRAWTYQRRLPFVRLGRRILLRRDDLDEFVTKNVVPARGDS